MTDDRRERPHLRVISEETPPPSQANDALVVGSAIIAALAGIGFAVGLALHTSIVVYGSALAIGLLALGFGVRRYFADKYPDLEAVEPRHTDRERDDPGTPISDVQPVERRSLLRRALLGASGIFGLSLLAPVPSLGPAPGDALKRTAWRRGTRLVTTAGDPIRADGVAAGGISTVWPEGAINNEISAVILVRLRQLAFEPPTNPEWIVGDELVAYSKVCTHAGCPVGLFRERDNALFCPCHQSTFDAVRGAIPTFGPTARALPQLPLGVDGQGYLIALGDFTEQVGPAYG
ncbi:MAG TPA: Rieske (2Fe-2S) protein [Euzebyales bacterium]|nr:Rieske (2Fe-2S) protein [Euzebyales bacterium]